MPDLFLSYSREDQPIARHFATRLEEAGFSVWWDQALRSGDSYDEVTEKALREASAVVVLWSPHSVASRWVRSEATIGHRSGRLVPVMIAPCERPVMFELTQTAELSGWKGDAADGRWQSLVEDLRRLIQRESSATAPAARALPAKDRPGPRRMPGWLVAAVAALAIAAGVLWSLRGERAAAAPVESSIAVLPFADMSPGGDQAWFGEGVAEQILDALARIPDPRLLVISRTSSFAAELKGQTVRAVGERLNVAHVLEGSVRKSPERIRVTAQLVRTDTGEHVWSQQYDRSDGDFLAIQEDIARAVAEALQVSMGVGLGQRAGMTRNLEAWEALLEARSLRMQYTPDTQRRAIGLLQNALDRDRDFAFAWGELAEGYGLMPTLTGEDPTPWYAKAEEALAEFGRILPDDPERYMRLAQLHLLEGRFKESMRYSRAAEAAAKRIGLHSPVMDPLISMLVGRTRDARKGAEDLQARDPLNPDLAASLARAYSALGDSAAAAAEDERALRLATEPMKFVLSSTAITHAMSSGDRSRVVYWLDRSNDLQPNPAAREWGIHLKSLLDRPAEARAFLHASASEPWAATPLGWSVIAHYLAYLGDPQGALEMLRRGGVRALVSTLASGLWEPHFKDVRKLPGFRDYVQETGLVELWREFGWPDPPLCRPVGESDFVCG